jgi:outer membrane protein OmpA-like peptidoglycan-associated protein
MMRWFTFIVLLFATVLPGRTQQDTLFPEDVWLTQIGISLYGASISHAGMFTLPQAPTCCTAYEQGGALGLAYGLSLRQEITKHVRFVVRGLVVPWSATFTTTENLLLAGQVSGTSRHELDVHLTAITGEALVDVRLPGHGRIMGGVWAGQYSQPTFSQREVLVTPSGGTFENQKRVRGETSNASLVGTPSMPLGLSLGGGWDWHLTENHSWTLTPEVLFMAPFEAIVEGLDWKASMLRAGVTLTYAVNAPKPPLPVLFKRQLSTDTVWVTLGAAAQERYAEGPERIQTDTLRTTSDITILDRVSRTDTMFVPELPKITANISVKAVDDGKPSDVFGIRVSTQFVTEALPVLPVVFFDGRSAQLSSRYRRISRPAEFSSGNIAPRTTDVHREVMNILGERLRARASSRIRLVGNIDPTTEAGDCDLARRRAEAVRDYLVSAWGIEAGRIDATTTATCVPERVTRQQSEDGYSENRRVEVVTDDLELLAPVGRKRFNETRGITPPRLLFDPAGSSRQFVEGWRLDVRTGGVQLFADSGAGNPSSLVRELNAVQAEQMTTGSPVQVELTLFGIRGVVERAVASIPVNKDTVSTEYERLTLTLFDVASDKVGAVAEAQIRSFVNTVPAGSTVRVRGFADLLGNAKFNQELSMKRATAVCNVLKNSMQRKVTLRCDEVSAGFPPGIESYGTPEERFLSRTVQIEVQRSRP